MSAWIVKHLKHLSAWILKHLKHFVCVDSSETFETQIVEDCFTPWLIHDEGELYLVSSRNLFFRSLLNIIIHLHHLKHILNSYCASEGNQ